MTEAQTDLARRLVAHPKWRWVNGMHANGDADQIIARDGSGGAARTLLARSPKTPRLPDLTDYATAAILLRMTMEAGAFNTATFMANRWACGVWEYTELVALSDGPTAESGPDLGTVAATALLAAWGA